MKKVLFGFFSLGFCHFLFASPGAEILRTLRGKDCFPWSKIEVIYDRKSKFPKAKYLDSTIHRTFKVFGGGVVKAFQTPRPSHRLSLLHYAPKPQKILHKTPVLLLHGVGTDATLTYFARNVDGAEGLAPYLVSHGFQVFAITFAVPHGSNIPHAIHITHGIKRILEVTQSQQVDIIAHSMGGLAARAMLVRLSKRIPKCKDKVRKLILLGTPNDGLDLTFRHPVSYLWFFRYGFPSPWLRYNSVDVSKQSIFSGCFNGHLEMCNPLFYAYPLGKMEKNVQATYYGKNFPGARSPGIAWAVKKGKYFIRRLNSKKMPPTIQLYLVGGTNNMLRYFDETGQVKKQLGEYDGVSDGLVFVKSALGERAFRKFKVKERFKVNVPHFELTYNQKIKAQILKWLTE